MRIVCVSCNTPVFEFSGRSRKFTPSDLKPLAGGKKSLNRKETLCPECGGKFYGLSLDGAACLFLGGDKWWPVSPLDLSY